eukprot:scaffold1699_cov114-Isochrysis_galbana.AAC.10
MSFAGAVADIAAEAWATRASIAGGHGDGVRCGPPGGDGEPVGGNSEIALSGPSRSHPTVKLPSLLLGGHVRAGIGGGAGDQV